MANKSKNNEVGRMNGLAAGLRKHLMGQVLSLNNTPVKVDDLLSRIDAFQAQLQTTAASRAAWTQQVGAGRVLSGVLLPQLLSLEDYLRVTLGAANPQLADYGITPRTPKKPSAPVMAVAVQKSAATREARHTMGKKQKASIHGVLPAQPAAPPGPPTGGGTTKPSS